MTERARRDSLLPHPRATALFARTIYRELRRARYDHQDLIRFVGQLTELVTSNLRKAPDALGRLSGVLDPETGLPNRGAFEEVLDFELHRAVDAESSLLLLSIDVAIPEWFPDGHVREVHERTSNALRRALRKGDVVARVSPNRYLVLVPAAGNGLVLELCARFGSALHGAEAERPLRAGVRYQIRWVVGAEGPAADLVERCMQAPAIPLGVIEDERPTSVNIDSLRPAPRMKDDGPARRVVLALGGGAVRAGAHVGVMDVLADANVEIAGIAGTSAGALVGAMRLGGKSHDEILARFEAFTTTTLYKELRSLYAAYMRRAHRTRTRDPYFRQSELSFMSRVEISAVPNELYAEFIEYFVGPDRDISTLERPFVACATDIHAGRVALFGRGPLHLALRAACAVPGLFAPQVDGERLLVDGSTLTEVPIAAATGLGLTAPTLAVHLERPTRKVERFATSAEVLTRTAAVVQTHLVREQLERAPLLLTVPVRDGGFLDFRRARETRQMGEVVSRMALEGLLADLERSVRATDGGVELPCSARDRGRLDVTDTFER